MVPSEVEQVVLKDRLPDRLYNLKCILQLFRQSMDTILFHPEAAWFSQFLGVLYEPELVFAVSMFLVQQYEFLEKLCHWSPLFHL